MAEPNIKTTTLDKSAVEGGGFQINFEMYNTDDPATVITLANLKSVTLDVVDDATETPIGATARDIKNDNNCEISAAGAAELSLVAADNALVGTATEWHIAVVKWTFDKTINSSPTEMAGIHNFRFQVVKDETA